MSRRESDDDYDNIVAQLGPKWRMIVCVDDYQWIVQERKGTQWRSQHFCTSRDGVLRRVKGKPGWEVLGSLPDHFMATGKDVRARRAQERASRAEGSPEGEAKSYAR
jgi:hypothetical protein